MDEPREGLRTRSLDKQTTREFGLKTWARTRFSMRTMGQWRLAVRVVEMSDSEAAPRCGRTLWAAERIRMSCAGWIKGYV